jgi:uncharacterized membrane protein
MALLAIAVSGYALTMMLFADLRPMLIRTLIADRPLAAFGHFTGGAIALAAGAFQMNGRLRLMFRPAHRWLGRLYVAAVVVGGVAGFSLALHSFGGGVAQMGFALLAVCWLACTINAYRLIRHGDVSAHRRWMIRSYAVTLSAVTLRFYLPGSQLAGLPMAVAYPAIAWLCWVPNLLVAEWFVRLRRSLALT